MSPGFTRVTLMRGVIFVYYRGPICVELYLHFPLRHNGVVPN